MGPEARRSVVLLVGGCRAALVATRALSDAGFDVVVGDDGGYRPLVASRHCTSVWRHPPISAPERFLDALTEYLAAHPEVRIVLPAREDSVALFAANQELLPDGVVFAMPTPSAVLTCLDKPVMYGVADRAGVPYPPFATVRDHEPIVEACEAVGFPVIIRPSGRGSASDQRDLKAAICSSTTEAEQTRAIWQSTIDEVFVQRYIPAPRHNVYFAARGGHVVALSESAILGTDRPDGTGINTEAVTVQPDPRVTEWTDALVRELDYTGVGLAQFLVPDASTAYFMELNPRFGAGLALPQALGLDLAVGACDLATSGSTDRLDPRAGKRVGKRYAWTTGAIRGAFRARGSRELTNRQALQLLGHIASSALRADVHSTWCLRDPGPTVAFYTDWLRRRAR